MSFLLVSTVIPPYWYSINFYLFLSLSLSFSMSRSVSQCLSLSLNALFQCGFLSVPRLKRLMFIEALNAFRHSTKSAEVSFFHCEFFPGTNITLFDISSSLFFAVSSICDFPSLPPPSSPARFHKPNLNQRKSKPSDNWI